MVALTDAPFYAPLKNTLNLSNGSGNATFTRATVATVFDNEGKLVTILANIPRFGGARRVENLIDNTVLPTVTTGTGNVSLSNGVFTLNNSASGSFTLYRYTGSNIANTQYRASLQYRKISGTGTLTVDINDAGILKSLSTEYEVHSYERKSILYSQGKKPRYLFFVVRGKVKSHRIHEDGKEYILGLFNQGDFLGYSPILKEMSYDETATVIEDADIMHIPKDEFLKMLFSDITIARKFIEIMAQNQKENEERLLNLAYSSLRKRVANALISINDKFNHGTDRPLEISREELAQYIGTATESLIRTLSDFKSEQLIETRNSKIIIRNTSKLKNMAY